MRTVNKNPNVSELKSFGWVMLCGFGVLGALLWYSNSRVPGAWSVHADWAVWKGSVKQMLAAAFWVLGPLVWLVSMVSPTAARPIYVVWMTGATYMGKASSFLLLSG